MTHQMQPLEPSKDSSAAPKPIIWLGTVSRALHHVAGLVLVSLMFMTIIDIVGRYLFDSPFRGSLELTELSMIVIIYLGLAYAEGQHDHIAVDILYNRLPVLVRQVLNILVGAFSIGVVGLLGNQLFAHAQLLDRGGYTTAVRSIPQYPVALLAVLGTALYMLKIASNTYLAYREIREVSS